jgi:ligand-binding sensor domain-containing protein/signal transduction histidine kinase
MKAVCNRIRSFKGTPMISITRAAMPDEATCVNHNHILRSSTGIRSKVLSPRCAPNCNRRVFAGVLLCIVFTAASIAAQSINVGMTQHSWGVEDGLPDRVIQAIAQTPNGYLWLGTPHGLVRFDGLKFVNFGTEMAPTLHEFGVSCILVAKDGTLWIGSVGGGVTHLGSHSAIHFGIDQGLKALTTRTLYQSGDGTIWAGTDSGLYRLVKDSFSFIKELNHETVTAIVSDGSGGFWVGGWNLMHYQHEKFLPVSLPPLHSVIRTLAVAPDGELWVGALGRLIELRKDGSIQIMRGVNADVRALCFDQTGKLWIGTIGSGVLLKMPDGVIIRELDPNEPDYKAVRAIVTVQNGDLWIGTHFGLTRMSHTGMDFVKISNSGTADFGSVFLDVNDTVWLSAGNLSRYSAEKVNIISLPALKGVQIRAVYREPSGAFWIGTVGNGAYRMVNDKVAIHLLGSTAITGFLGAPDGSLWIGTDQGLAKWSQGKFTHFIHDGNTTMSTVKAMALGPDGSVWLATPAGLFLFRNGNYLRTEVARKLANFRVWSLYAGKDGSLWIGTGTGLYLWRRGTLAHIDFPKSILQSQAVISILVDARGRFLIAQPTAVFRFGGDDLNRPTDIPQNIGPDTVQQVHILTAPEIFAVGSEAGTELYSEIPGVASTDQQGGAWYATSQGLVHIAASPLSRLHIPPPVTIERILVDGVRVSENEKIVLPSSTHNLQIEATPILLGASTGLELRRRLLGLDDEWSELLPGSSSSYGRLPPGQYTFKVQAYWLGTNTASSAEVTIVQQSAIYQRTWFLALCGLSAAIIGWLVYHFRIHQMRLRFQAVADERSRVAREIHDTLLQGCIGALSLLEAVEISHERARDDLSASRENRWLTMVQCVCEQFELTIKEAREAIWNLRNADDRKPLDEALCDTIKRLTSPAEVETTFQVEGDAVPIIPRVQHEIIMSAREAIMNAVCHARPVSINVRLSFDSRSVTVAICDDGIGFDTNALRDAESEHFGLSGMRDRMHKFRGSMTVESQPGRGTNVYLTLPLDACRIRKH